MSLLHPISGCDNADRKADVVFVHGLGGDAFGTWRYGEDESTSWPHWLGEDFPAVGVWSLGYAASPTKWARLRGLFSDSFPDAGQGISLADRAPEVLELMSQRGVGERPLLFVGHSLGGLVIKQLLRKSSDAIEDRLKNVFRNTRAVLFLATPHAGADLASLAGAFRTLFQATITIQELAAHDAHLRDLYGWYRDHAADAGIRTACYYELRAFRGALIVNPTSAQPGVGENPVGLEFDHISIAKPQDRQALVCGTARRLLRDYVLAPRQVTLQHPTSVHVPHELPTGAEQFFGRGEELKKLKKRLESRLNTAVVGPAGMGKTALAANALRAVFGEQRNSLASSLFPSGIVYLDLYTLRGVASAAWDSLANKLELPGFMERSPARDRAAAACQSRQILVVIEGGEEADGCEGRTDRQELFSVLSPESRWLLLTRSSTQALASATVFVKETLYPDDAAQLFDSLTGGRLSGGPRLETLRLLDGHPLALTWAGNLLAQGDDHPKSLIVDWTANPLLTLSDPAQREHTLEWLFHRSARGLDSSAQQALAAAGLLAPAHFPLAAIDAALSGPAGAGRHALRELAQRSLLRPSATDDHWEFTHVLGYRFARKEVGSDRNLRTRLGTWLDGHLTALLAGKAGVGEMASITGALEHLGALLLTDDDQSLWNPLTEDALYNFRDRLRDLGRRGQVQLVLDAVNAWFEQLPPDKAKEPEWKRERTSLLDRRGDLLRAQGDLAGALVAYQQALAVSEQLAQSDPSDAYLQRDVTVCHNKIGGLLEDQGNLTGALAEYSAALALRERLAGAGPSEAVWQHDVGASKIKVGDVLQAQGDLAGALTAYQESLAEFDRASLADPSNLSWQRDMSISQERAGEVLQAQGDLAGALAAFRESLDVRQRLARADPSNAGWQLDASMGQERIGGVLEVQGDLAGALAAYQRSRAVRQFLAQADPSNLVWQRDASVSLNRVGSVLQDQGDLAGALAVYRESLDIRQGLARADPSNAGWQRDVSVSLNRMAGLHAQNGAIAEARTLAQRSLEIVEDLAALDPTNAVWQYDLAFTRALVARLAG